jgi:Peptidase MA superfamily
MLRILIPLLIIVLLVPALALAQSQSWETIETDNFMIYYPPDEHGAGEALAKVAEPIRKKTVKVIGYDFKHKTRVYLAPDRETYESIQPRAKVPEWSVGVAFENENLIVQYTPRGARKEGFNYDLVKVFHHELCHIVLGLALRDQKIPRWLDEGFAKYLAHEWSSGDTFRMTVAVVFGRLIPLNELMNAFPKDENQARIAYLESKSFVSFLARIKVLPRIIRGMRSGLTAEAAVARSTGYSMSVLEERWLKYLKRRHTWIYLAMRTEVIWSSMAILFLIAYWRVRIRMKRKLRRMELEEEIEDQPPGPSFN